MTPHLARLLEIMARLRDPISGCEWDRAQSFATIAPYTIEEAYEVADAIARDNHLALRSELGDLLLQVVFHARIAEESGLFGFDDVAEAICAKLIARHPHIFDDAADTGEDQRDRWERLKADERQAEGATSALDGVALALPGLLRAEKLQKRAARVGFDWPGTEGPLAKLAEEMDELAQADAAHIVEEAGDLLFSAVNVVRAFGVAPEDAMRAANAKFERRFRHMERLAHERALAFDQLTLDEQEELWQAVKRSEAAKAP